MPLSPLSLNITTGVVGRPFSATISGQSSGSTVEVIGYDGTPGFSTVNGRVLHSGLPYQVNTVVLRETLPGEGFRDSRIDIVADGVALGLAGLPAALETMPGYPSARQVGTSIIGDGVAAPASNLTAAAGSAGALTGTYYWTQTFVTALGETAPWSGTGTGVALSSQRGSLSNIPIGPAGTTARRIYRTKATSTDPKDYYLVGTINDNTTTTYLDNAADAALGAAVKWTASNMGYILTADGVVASFSGSGSVVLGQGAQASYASVAIGGQSGSPTGFRTVSIGIYAGVSVTTGKENTFAGTHAGQGIATGNGNLILGCYAGIGPSGTAGPYTAGTQNFNVMLGTGVFGNATGLGSGSVAIGYRALYQANSADQVIGIGFFAGQFANASRQLFIDNVQRANIGAAQDQGLIYAKGESTPQTQVMNLNAGVRVGAVVTVANLPTATGNGGRRFVVSDASVAYASANVGTTVAGGGSNTVPVFCNGTAWVIG